MTIDLIGATAAMDAWEIRVKDKRPRVQTGFAELDESMHRGGFAPGELVILGGRTHTRKTTVALNMMASLLSRGVPVGFVSLDETLAGYVAKLTSIMTGLPMQDLEERWDDLRDRRVEASQKMAGLTLTRGFRPTFDALHAWIEMAEDFGSGRPQVVFMDYISLLGREKYSGQEVQRVQRLVEDLQVWTSQEEVVTIALHQVGRTDEGTNKRYHGDKPMTLESLKFGGEEIADIVLGTYRPSLSPVGNMSPDEAKAEGIDDETWQDARSRVEQYKDITFLQLLKNRPGVHLNHRGIMLRSPNEALGMVPADGGLGDSDKVVSLRG
jgi:replicative DNA helicase